MTELGIPMSAYGAFQAPSRSSNIDLQICDAALERPTITLLKRTHHFIDSTSELLEAEFIKLYGRDRKKSIGNSCPESLNFLRRHGLHCPQFTVYDHITSDDFLASTPFSEQNIQPGNLLLVFQLPPLIARQNGRRHVDKAPRNSAVNWGNFEQPLAMKLRKNIEKFKVKDEYLDLRRLNKERVHDSRLFHYVWEVSFPPTSYFMKHRNGHNFSK